MPIIGILAAVGVVAYNGYTKSAKANHKKVVKFITASFMKCSIGEKLTLQPFPNKDYCWAGHVTGLGDKKITIGPSLLKIILNFLNGLILMIMEYPV